MCISICGVTLWNGVFVELKCSKNMKWFKKMGQGYLGVFERFGDEAGEVH